MSINLNFNINVDANELLEQITSSTQRTSFSDQWLDDNKCRWIHGQGGGLLYSCCYHEEKQHSATVQVYNNFKQKFGEPKKLVRQKKSIAPPGRWAVAYIKSGAFGGDEAYYDYW